MNKEEIRFLIAKLQTELVIIEGETIEAEVTELAQPGTELILYNGDPLENIFHDDQEQPEPDIYDVPTAPLTPQLKKRNFIMPAISIALVIIFLSATLTYFILPVFTSRATITIFPETQTLSKSFVVTQKELTIKSFNPVIETTSKTIATTGITIIPATPGQGTITFFNASPNAQIIDAGTQITASNGVIATTDTTVTIAPSNPPVETKASVHAHTLNTGAISNLVANAIAEPCCKPFLLAYNSPFYGGKEATSYKTVSVEDIARTAAALKNVLDEKTKTLINSQSNKNEIILQSNCNTQTQTSQPAGAIATEITVTETENCNGSTYNKSGLDRAAQNYLITQAQSIYGTEYLPSGEIATELKNITNQQNIFSFMVTANGTFSYSLSNKQQRELKSDIAGKTRQEATLILFRKRGVAKANIQSPDTLPDAKRIDINVVEIQ